MALTTVVAGLVLALVGAVLTGLLAREAHSYLPDLARWICRRGARWSEPSERARYLEEARDHVECDIEAGHLLTAVVRAAGQFTSQVRSAGISGWVERGRAAVLVRRLLTASFGAGAALALVATIDIIGAVIAYLVAACARNFAFLSVERPPGWSLSYGLRTGGLVAFVTTVVTVDPISILAAGFISAVAVSGSLGPTDSVATRVSRLLQRRATRPRQTR